MPELNGLERKVRLQELQPAHQQKNDQDQQNQSQTAARVVAPSGAVGPGGKRSHYQQKHDDQENQSHVCPLNEQVVRGYCLAAHAG